MDILSHGLWAVAAGKGSRLESTTKLKYRWLFFWGVFPDAFAFGPVFVWSIIGKLFGGVTMFNQPMNVYEPWTPGFDTFSNASQFLYQLSHSFFIFILVALIMWLATKRVPWVMLGWPLHILADIPTHSYLFYPTPAFWPFWNWKFDGFQLGFENFTLYNYLALILVFGLLYGLTRVRRGKTG